MMKCSVLLFMLCFSVMAAEAQTNAMRQQYELFRQQAHDDYDDFRDKANRRYAEFLKEAWQSFNALPAIPKPKDEKVLPVVVPDDEKEATIVESTPVTIETVVEPPVLKAQPVPLAPIRNVPRLVEKYVAFDFYGAECKVRFDDECKFSLDGISRDVMATVWQRLSGDTYNNLIRDCLSLRMDMKLCDWAYLLMLRAASEACLGKTDEAVLLTAFIYCQSGYKMRLGMADGHPVLLYGTEHNIYARPYYAIDGTNYYALDRDIQQLEISRSSCHGCML